MGLSNKLSYEARCSFRHLNPHRFFQSEVLRLYFPTLESWVAWSVSLPSCSSWIICTQVWDCLTLQLPPCLPCLPPCCTSSPPWLPIAVPSTNLDGCFFFNSLVVRLPFSIIFWYSDCFFFLNLVLFCFVFCFFFFWLFGEAVYLLTRPYWPRL